MGTMSHGGICLPVTPVVKNNFRKRKLPLSMIFLIKMLIHKREENVKIKINFVSIVISLRSVHIERVTLRLRL